MPRLRIFDRYIFSQVAWSTLMGVLVLTGVMVLGTVFKEMERLLGDTSSLPILAVLQFISYVIPYSLIFTIPWALLTAILLVFGRMSADNEMTALRMTGMPMWRICMPVFILAVAMSGVCFWVNIQLAPMAKTKIKRLFYDLALDDPAVLFQEGKVLEKFPGYRIFTKKRKDKKLWDVEIVQTTLGNMERYIRAERAEVEVTPGVTDFILRLYDCQIETTKADEAPPAPSAATAAAATVPAAPVEDDPSAKFQPLYAKEFAISFPLSELKAKTERVSNSMKSTDDLWTEVKTGVSVVNGQPMTKSLISAVRTEISLRYSFSLVAIVFCLVGIPLAVTAQRRETSIGFALSLLVAVSYQVFVILASNLAEKRGAYPHILMWLPTLLFTAVGVRLFYKLSRK
ncbi:lipopolysaccharide export system permease protein [Roseimicrobium gellanilyticum]|uniref:Lipopolysaccharide export system permease protein n=1 Tax=Roseimicrobium gellanilyticum TaxID=748857 RepID=A0A366H3W3_9BACT|nr:LptF/LptG family permease [Roseimicrobium gellanilyticum]RBP35512.1 lipopolysaccharide export system permease protein [Roseimicrobium gellanilyticum]